MKKVRMFTLSFTFVLVCIVTLLANGGGVHAATQQASRSSSCGFVSQTFALWTSSSPNGLELTRSSDGTGILLAATATSDELNFGMATLYEWIKYPGQNNWTYNGYATIQRSFPIEVVDVGVSMTIYGQATPEATYNYCEWTYQKVYIS
jgi:hypothetical protein